MQTFYDHEMTTVAMTNHVVAVLIMFTNLPKKSWFSSFWPHSDLEIWSRPLKLVWKWKSQWSFFSCPVWKISFKHSLRKSQCYDVLAKSESVNYLSLHTYWSCEKPSLFLLFLFFCMIMFMWNNHTKFEFQGIRTCHENAICGLAFSTNL